MIPERKCLNALFYFQHGKGPLIRVAERRNELLAPLLGLAHQQEWLTTATFGPREFFSLQDMIFLQAAVHLCAMRARLLPNHILSPTTRSRVDGVWGNSSILIPYSTVMPPF